MSMTTERPPALLVTGHNPLTAKVGIIPAQADSADANPRRIFEARLMTDLATNAMRDQLDLLLVTARRVAESLELDTVLTSIVEDATTLLGADSGDILLWDRDRDVLRVVAVSNFPPDMLGFEVPFGEGLSSQAILAQRTMEVADYGTYEHRIRALDQYDFGTVLCAPLLFRGAAIGAINLHARHRQHQFPPGSGDLLAAFAGHAAIAIDHARRYENEVNLGRDLAESNRELTRLLTVQQRLAEHVLLDGGPIGIATVLAEDLGRDVVIQDYLHRLIAGASPDGGDAWRRLVEERRTGGVDVPGREPFEVAVRVGREVAGHLLLSSDDDLGAIDRALVDAATTGVALAFAKVRAAVEVEERLRGEAATDLLSGTYTSEDAIAHRAARLGYDLSEPRDLLVIDVGHDVDAEDPGTLSGHDRQRRFLDVVRERLAGRAPRSLAVLHAGSIVVLASAPRPNDLDARELACDLQASVAGIAGAGPISVAVADRCERPDDYAPAFRLARESVELMLKLGRGGAVVATSDLGSYGLLLRASSRDDLEAFARRTLRPLLEYDRGHGGELLHTLRVFLEEDRVQRRAAARCFVHVNTVVYRVRRIEELLGVDLGDPSTVFDITLALRILDLLGDTPAATSGATTEAPGAGAAR
jgi:sugar diacid utilization regulator/GAF domain-containing protein